MRILTTALPAFMRKSIMDHTRKTVCLLILALAVFPRVALAATAKATVSKNTVELNEPFQFQISVDANLGNNALNLTPLEKHFNYGRPHLSNSTSITNGTVTRLTQWRVVLAAKEVGNFTIPSFTIDGMKTLPIKIKVLATSPKNKSNEDAIKIISTLNREDGYIGETFTYHVRLMIGARVDSPTLQPPFGEGLMVEQIGEDVQSETLINGRQYILVNRQYQITPTKVGQLYLEGATLTGTQITGNKWGSTLGVPFNRKAKLSALNVKEKPQGYTGLWLPTPALELSQHWEPDALEDIALSQAAKDKDASNKRFPVTVGEPINRIITLKIKHIAQSSFPDLNIKYPDSVRVYSDKPEYSEENNVRTMRVKQVIIPRKEGEITLPAMKIKWFNTTTKKEETTQIPGISLDVKPGESALNAQPVLPPTPLIQNSATPNQMLLGSKYWPWATALFAFLWVVTLILYLGKLNVIKMPLKSMPRFTSPPKSAFDELKNAVLINDAMTVATQFPLWNASHLPKDLHNEIDEEIQSMMAAYYSKDTNSWKNDHLLLLLKKAAKVKSGTRKSSILDDLK